jgi:TRAP-type C4-dicarboxylate transport system permease small subunit
MATGTVGISEGWRVVSILVGMSLAAVIAILRLIETTTLRQFLLAVLVVGGVSLLLWFFQPQLDAMKFGSLFVFFILIVGACVASVCRSHSPSASRLCPTWL